MNRRAFVRTIGIAVATAPLLAVRELTKPAPPASLPILETNSVLTADYLAELVGRINTLSREMR